MTTWILLTVMLAREAVSLTNFPGFHSLEDCENAANLIVKKLPSFPIMTACIPQPGKNKK